MHVKWVDSRAEWHSVLYQQPDTPNRRAVRRGPAADLRTQLVAGLVTFFLINSRAEGLLEATCHSYGRCLEGLESCSARQAYPRLG